MIKVLNNFFLLGFIIFILVVPRVTQAQSNHIVINEIQVAGETARDEFVELYNPTNADIDISGWSMQYKSATGVSFTKKNFIAGAVIPAGGYYLIAHGDFTGPVPDMSHRTISMGSPGGNIYLVNSLDKLTIGYDSDQVIDHVAWGTGNDPEGSAALVPTALSSINRSNGQDTDNNASDFVIQASTPGQPNKDQESATNDQEETATEEESTENPVEPDETTEPEEEKIENIDTEDEIVADPVESDETSDLGAGPEEPSSDFPTTGKVVINELIPNPEGLDSQGEWIELKNIDTKTIDLNSWQLADLSKSYTLSADDYSSLLLEAGSYLVIPRTLSRLALNNTGREALSLVDSAGRVIDMVVYEGEIPENQSYARSASGFFWTTTLTQGSDNVITQPIIETVLEVDKTSNQKLENIEETENESINSDPQLITDNPEGQADGTGFQPKSDPQDYSSLIINELIPNPAGDDRQGEWIELYNKADLAIDLAGLKVGDSSSKIYEIASGSIGAQDYYLIYRQVSGIALNNNGDAVKLWSPDGALIASTRYFGTAVSGEAYAFSRASGLWDWTVTPTPGEANIFSQVLGVETKSDETASSAPASSYKRSIKPNFLINNTVSLAEVKSLKVGAKLTTQGAVAVKPKIFGKTYFYIVDGKSGIRVYSAKSDFPELKIGDLIQITGTLSDSNQELRIKISQASDIQVLENADPPAPVAVELAEINEFLEGSLVQIFGEVTSVKSSNIYIADETAEVRVYLAAGTKIDQSIYRSGDKLQVIGLLSETKAGFRVMPRSPDDIKLIHAEVAGAATESVLVKNRSNNTNPLIYIYLLAGAGIIVALILLNKKFGWLKFSQNKKGSNE